MAGWSKQYLHAGFDRTAPHVPALLQICLGFGATLCPVSSTVRADLSGRRLPCPGGHPQLWTMDNDSSEPLECGALRAALVLLSVQVTGSGCSGLLYTALQPTAAQTATS